MFRVWGEERVSVENIFEAHTVMEFTSVILTDEMFFLIFFFATTFNDTPGIIVFVGVAT